MANISAKDIASFGKIFQAIGRLMEEQPIRTFELLQELVHELSAIEKPEHIGVADREDSVKFAELRSFNILELAKEKSKAELVEFLSRFDTEQLRYLIRLNRFGAIKSKSLRTLSDHIADQAIKRGIDVFKSHS